jgi:hypothetical protein
MEGEFTLIFPVGLVKPFLTLTRGKRPHFVARETVTSPPPNKWKEAAKGGACCDARSSENPGGTSEEGKNCSLHFLPLKFLHPMKQVAVGKRKG